MNAPSSHQESRLPCRPARIGKAVQILAVMLMAFASTSLKANAQTYSERLGLIGALNNAMVNLMLQATADPDDPHSVVVAMPVGITIKGYDGECAPPASVNLEYEPHIEPGNLSSPAGVRLAVTLRSAGEMDIPEFAHALVCQMNAMIWHLFNGNYQTNWVLDEEQNIVVVPRNFDANCTTATSQKFWMIDQDVVYGSGQMNPAIPGNMWRPLQPHDGRLWNIADPNPVNHFEEDGTIYTTDFIKPGNAGKEIWIVRDGNPGDEQLEIKRAYTRIVFDHDYYDHSTSTPVLSTTQEYVDPFHDPGWGYAKKLTAMELIARPHAYSPDDCPQTNPAVQPLSDRSELQMTLYYVDDMGVACSTSCVQSWSAVPANPDADNQNLWDRMFGNYGRAWGEFDIDENGVLYYESTACSTGSGACVSNPDRFGLIKLRDRSVPADRCEMMLGLNGIFTLDLMTGEIIYTVGSSTERLFCFDFCETLSGSLTFTNALSASAQTFSDQWTYDPSAHGTWNMGQDGGSPHYDPGEAFEPFYGMPDNAFQRAERGKWHPEKAYVYRSAVKPGIGTDRVYDAAGVFTDNTGDPADAFTLFNWREPADNVDNWLNFTTVTQYSPSGESVEERDIQGVYHTSALAHKEMIPRLLVDNATYNAVDFESFEEFSPSGSYVASFSHSGEISFQLGSGSFSDELTLVNLTDQIIQDGLLVKFWLKQSYNVLDANPGFNDPPVAVQVGSQTYSILASDSYNTFDPGILHKIAQTGEWSLFQLLIADFGSLQVGDDISVRMKNNIPPVYNDNVYVDDIRMQPLNASLMCFVYDRHTLREIAQFDDQHFGVYLRYNGEGDIVSIARETENGITTISEFQSWILSQPRFSAAGATKSHSSVPFMSIHNDKSSQTAASGIHSQGTEFDVLSLSIGPEGPTANLFGGKSVPLDDLQELLDFSADFPQIETDNLASLAPDLPEVERLRYVRELMKLDEQRAELERGLEETADAEKKKRLEEQRAKIDRKRDALLREKLGLSSQEIEALYNELRSESGPVNSEEN